MTVYTHDPDQHLHASPPDHPETACRLDAIVAAIRTVHQDEKYRFIAPDKASWDTIAQVHTPRYIAELQSLNTEFGYLDADTYYTAH